MLGGDSHKKKKKHSDDYYYRGKRLIINTEDVFFSLTKVSSPVLFSPST